MGRRGRPGEREHTQSGVVFHRAIALSVEDEVLGAFGEALGDDLGVERVGKTLGQSLNSRLVVMQVERR